MAAQPERLILTHYSAITPSSRIIAGLHEQIDHLVTLTQAAAEQYEPDQIQDQLSNMVLDYFIQRACNELPNLDEGVARKWLGLDATLNAQGLAYWWQYRRAA